MRMRLTCIGVVGGPAVTSIERKALTGTGDGDGVGDGDGGSDGDGLGAGEGVAGGVGVGDAATRSHQRGRVARTRSNAMRSSVGYITPAAMAPTTPKLVPGIATSGRAR